MPVMGPSTRPSPRDGSLGAADAKKATLPSRRYHKPAITHTDQGPGPKYKPTATTETGKLTSAQHAFPKESTYRTDKTSRKDVRPQVVVVPGPGSYANVSMMPTGDGSAIGHRTARASFGKTTEKYAAPAHVFGSETQRDKPPGLSPRFLATGPEVYGMGASPGPQAYVMNDAVGSTSRGHPAPNAPHFSMSPRLEAYQPPLGMLPRQRPPSGEASKTSTPRDLLPPADNRVYHPQPVAFGKQAQSTRQNEPYYGFSKSVQRPDTLGKNIPFLGKEQAFERLGVETATVRDYSVGHAMGFSRAVTQKASPRFTFGSESRF